MQELSINTTDPSYSNTFFFPLRTNVQYFDSQETQLKLEERIKQAALLHDNLLFEAGTYHATVWEREGGGPSFDMWYPPSSSDLDPLEDSFQPTGGQPVLLLDSFVFASGPAERQFRAQFHSLLRKFNAADLPWIKTEPFGLPNDIDNYVKQLGRDDEKLVQRLIPQASRFLRAKISYNLNRDLVVSGCLRVATSLDDLFSPLVHEKARSIRESNLR